MCWGEWCSFLTAVKSYACTSGHRLAPRTSECKFISSLILHWSAMHRRNTIIHSRLTVYMPTSTVLHLFFQFLAFCGQYIPVLVLLCSSVCKLARLRIGAISESIIVIQIWFYALVWWVLLRTYGNNAVSSYRPTVHFPICWYSLTLLGKNKGDCSVWTSLYDKEKIS